MTEYRKWGLEDAARADAARSHAARANAPPPAIAAVVAPPPANAVVVEQAPEAQAPERRTPGTIMDYDPSDYSPLPAGQENATSSVIEAMNLEDDELYYSPLPDPSAAAQDNEDDEITEEESGAQGYWNPGSR